MRYPSRDAIARVKLPAILKTRRFGYDGKGQALIRNRPRAPAALKRASAASPPCSKAFVAFEREMSVVVVRGQDGELHFYDLDRERAPERHPRHQPRARPHSRRHGASRPDDIAGKIAEALAYVGVLCVEMFERDGKPQSSLVNEIAPRVHNSGHWTIDACLVSQFENHIRAICGLAARRHRPPQRRGDDQSDRATMSSAGARSPREDGVALHLYGKTEARPGRKMGHTTRLLPKS